MNAIWINKCGHIHSYGEGGFDLVNFNIDDKCFRCGNGIIGSYTGTAKLVKSWLRAK